MHAILVPVVAVLVLLNVVTFGVFARLMWRIRRYRPPLVRDAELPEAAIILSVRGGNERLTKVLDRLVAQSYPRYRLYVVVDHVTDPAWEIVRRWHAAGHAVPVSVQLRRERLPRATLKFSAVHQVVEQLPPQVGAVAIVDADADPYSHWLRDLVAPLTQPDVAAATGQRWYFPRRASFGGWCRFIINGCTLPYMEADSHSWGGSLALRRDFVDSPEFRDAFGRLGIPTEEQATYKALHALRRKLVDSPHVWLLNPESTTVHKCYEFIARQYFWDRLYVSYWGAVIGFHLVGLATIVAGLGFGLTSLLSGSRDFWAELALFGVGAFWLNVVGSLCAIHGLLRRRVMPRQGRTLPALTLQRVAQILAAAPMALLISTAAALKAQRTRFVRWSGIRYNLVPPYSVRPLKYRPWKRSRSAARQRAALPLPRTA